MKAVCLVDTSIFCELLRVPHMCSDALVIADDFESKLGRGETFLLPMTTILETGNHVGQVKNGSKRREAALRFVKRVVEMIDGGSPFSPTRSLEAEALRELLANFPEWTKTTESGLGDLSISEEWRQECSLHPRARVYVWSKDRHLQAFDRPGQ
ncbi:MAG: hypothetical protein ACYC99_17990 [Candidatus Geothermincolia bacterium]